MIIVFFGPPGSGKGTQAQELRKTIKNLVHVSTGDILRQEINSGSELGRSIQSKMQAGEFVTDEVVIQLVSDILNKNAEKAFIFDGFPRTLKQAIAFDRLLGVENLKVDVVFDFDVDVQVLIERVTGRYLCLECGAVYHETNRKPKIDSICDQCGSCNFDKRPDDTSHVLKTRLKIYQEQTTPAKKYYEDKGVLKRINASLPQGEVTSFINTALLEAGLIRRGE
ncbi:MAG: adenylate kinase [Alphaproteobacteria bacterium]|jgi:adenylate kinase|nr:adenylate kinase [Alphaproteobacteria bacterium]